MNEFTKREQQLLNLLDSERNTYQDLAQQLGISPKTVQSHLQNMYRKADVHDKTALLSKANRQGWLSQSPNGE